MLALLAVPFLAGAGLLVYGLLSLRRVPPEFNQATVTINGHVFHVSLADTAAKRSQGLSGHSALRADEGMLFLFTAAFRYPFWMKDMLFPLDMIWIQGDRVVDITPNVPIPAAGQSIWTLPTYSPRTAADKVLEVNAGTAAADGLKIGDPAQVQLPPGEQAS